MTDKYRGLKHPPTVGFFFESGVTDRIEDRSVIAGVPVVSENT